VAKPEIARERNIRLETDRRDYVPGESVRVVIMSDRAAGGTLAVTDGAGRVYVEGRLDLVCEVAADFTFTVVGALGGHLVRYTADDEGFVHTAAIDVDARTRLECDDAQLSELVGLVRSFLGNDISEFDVDGSHVRGYRSPDTTPVWLRDHAHQMKGAKYFERQIRSAVDWFIESQLPDGSVYDYIRFNGDRHRCPIEADCEYLLVEAAATAWQATGDDGWLRRILPALEKALVYSMTDPFRWSDEHKLVKRAFTVDTWDYEYHNYPWDADKTKMGIMHGDNSGMYHAASILADVFGRFGDEGKAAHWSKVADGFRKRTNELCWNGTFYRHRVAIDDIEINVEGGTEDEQLSLSNPYNINRGLPTHEMALSIIDEYKRRRDTVDSFAEWFSIHPPFVAGSFGTTGWALYPYQYTNGGILPLVGGELARAAFEHGRESYGVDILRRYARMAVERGETFLWYWPDGTPGRSAASTLPTDGWGSAAMLYALVEGLAGIVDAGKRYDDVIVSPRWSAAGIKHAAVTARYAASYGYCQYTFDADDAEIRIDYTGSSAKVRFHVLIPEGRRVANVVADGTSVEFSRSEVESSRYVNFEAQAPAGSVSVVLD